MPGTVAIVPGDRRYSPVRFIVQSTLTALRVEGRQLKEYSEVVLLLSGCNTSISFILRALIITGRMI